MKRKVKMFLVVALVAVVGVCHVVVSHESSNLSDWVLPDLESLAACESIGWWDNDGNCVKNDAGVYFCKSDSWPALTDCLQ